MPLHPIANFPFKPFIFESLPFIGLILCVDMVSRIALGYQIHLVNMIAKRMGVRLYADGLRHSLTLPYQAFEDKTSGEVLSRLQKARTTVEKLVQVVMNALFTTLVSIVCVSWYAVTVYWPIAFIYLVAIPVLVFLNSFVNDRLGGYQKSIADATDSLASSTAESLRNIELVKSLGLVQQETERLKAATEKMLKLEQWFSKHLISINFVGGTFLSLVRASLLLFMISIVVRNLISLGDFILFTTYSVVVFEQIKSLGDFTKLYHETKFSLFSVQEIFDMPSIAKQQYTVPVTPLETLSFDNVEFKHASADVPTLNAITFAVRIGETIAFVGPTGAGKTTLIKLLLGLYPPLCGQIQYNGIPKEDIDFDEIRSQTGLVTQDTQLFSGTVSQNLRFVAPNATDEECIAALHNASADAFGLDAKIGENGVKLSGGERQRLSIARALLRHPALLIFDEATSALDSITEAEVVKSIREISGTQQYITIIIAHRLSTVMHADKIFVLERGKVIEVGTHEKLLLNHGLYHAMWRQQIGHSGGIEVG